MVLGLLGFRGAHHPHALVGTYLARLQDPGSVTQRHDLRLEGPEYCGGQASLSSSPGILAIVAAALVIAPGCTITHVGRYDARHFALAPVAPEMKLPGSALVITSVAQDEEILTARPDTFTGSALSLSLPAGRIVRAAALRVFGDLFDGGANAVHEVAGTEQSGIIIAPRLVSIRYRFEGLGSTVIMSASLAVQARDALGRVLIDETYDSGRIEVPRARSVEPAGESLTRAAHQIIQGLMLRAGYQLRARIVASERG